MTEQIRKIHIAALTGPQQIVLHTIMTLRLRDKIQRILLESFLPNADVSLMRLMRLVDYYFSQWEELVGSFPSIHQTHLAIPTRVYVYNTRALRELIVALREYKQHRFYNTVSKSTHQYILQYYDKTLALLQESLQYQYTTDELKGVI